MTRIKPVDGEYRLYVKSSNGKFVPLNPNTPKGTLTFYKSHDSTILINGEKVEVKGYKKYSFENVKSFDVGTVESIKLSSTGGAVPLKYFKIYYCEDIDLCDVDASQITSMKDAFYGCTLPKGLSLWNLENCETLENTFNGAKADYIVQLNNWVTAKTKSLKNAFYCANFKLTKESTASWDITSVEDWSGAFQQFKGTILDFRVHKPYNLENGANMENAFRDSSLQEIYLYLDRTVTDYYLPIRNARYMFANTNNVYPFHFYCKFLDGCDITGMYYNGFNKQNTFGTGTAKIGAMDYAFAENKSLSSFTISTNLNTERCTSMLGIFRNCSSLTDVYFPSTGFSLEGVKTANGLTDMFKGCYKLKNIRFSSNSGTWSNATLDLSDCNKDGNYELNYNTYDSMLSWPTRTGDLASSPAYIAFNSAANVSFISTFTDQMTAKGFTIVLK